MMEKRMLGRTGLEVSAIGMGCEAFESLDYEASEKLLDYAVSMGINCFDVYTSNPAVRSKMGKALQKYPRASFVIQGHLGTDWQNEQYCRTRDIEAVKASFNNLLQDMQLDYVDIGMIHYCDDKKDFDIIFEGEVIKYAKELKEQGIIGCIGLSTHNTDVALWAVETGLIDVIMFSVNPAYDMLPACDDVEHFFEEDAFDVVYEGIDPKREQLYSICRNEGVALTVMKPFAGGLLLDEKQTPFGEAMTPVQCLAYCLDRPAVASVMAGMSDIEQIDAALAYLDASKQEKDYSLVLASAPKQAFRGHCMYCGHCAPCSVKIDIAAVNKYLDLALAQGFVPETVREHYEVLEHHASECIACGNCMSNCPFGTDIIAKMEEAASLFGK